MRRLDLSTSVVSRGRGSSAVKAAAYQSGETIRVERTGELARYSRTEKVIDLGVFTPTGAPELSRSELWNKVERDATGDHARLARKFVLRLPNEVDPDTARKMVERFVGGLTGGGAYADAAIHVKPGNLHAHVMMTDRAWDARRGDWKEKCRKAYLVRDGRGGERHMTPDELRARKGEGWAKVYRWRREGEGRETRPARMTMAEAEAANGALAGGEAAWVRQSKTAVDKKVSETAWSTRAQLVAWRHEWERICNDEIRRMGVGETVSCESYETLGLAQMGYVPTVHEGYSTALRERNEEILRHNRRVAALWTRLRETVRERRATAQSLRAMAIRAARLPHAALSGAIDVGRAAAERLRLSVIFSGWGPHARTEDPFGPVPTPAEVAAQTAAALHGMGVGRQETRRQMGRGW